MTNPIAQNPSSIEIDSIECNTNSFQQIRKKIASYSLDSFSNLALAQQYADDFGLRQLVTQLAVDRIDSSSAALRRSVVAFEEKPFEPKYQDLCRLHFLVLQRKVINVLEFGSGFSTAVMADAMRILQQHFGSWVKKNIRCEFPHHVYAVEEDQRFLEITKSRLSGGLSGFASVSKSSVELITHDNRFVTVYSRLPNISPDLIYLDGPSQYATTAEVNGFSLTSSVRMPMSADILRFEFFLEPGTLIVVDGRTQNARFLKSYFKRNWAYRHDTDGDVHYFELQEEPLGRFNSRKIDFCLEGKWLLS
jgi:hypothetical protein